MFNRLKHIGWTNRLARRPPVLYPAAMKTIDRVEALDRAGREAFQQERLRDVLQRARRLPGYRDAPASDILSDWPILQKAQMRGHERDFMTNGLLPSTGAKTGGTSGVPLRLNRSPRGVAFEAATIDRVFGVRGADITRMRTAVLRGDPIKPASDMTPPFWKDEGPSKRIFSVYHLARASAPWYLDAIRAFKPEIVYCYPTSLASLLEFITPADNIRVPLILTSSEILTPQTMQRARETLGADVIDFYGQSERIVCAFACNDSNYRFEPAYGHVELVPEGDGFARVIATSLWDHGQIFVRYDTGDLARVPSHDPRILRDIALGVLPFGGIEGRGDETIDLPDGRRIYAINQIPRGVEGASSIQLHYTGGDTVDIYIMPAENFSAETIRHVVYNFYQRFPACVKPRLFRVDGPIRERNGKALVTMRNPVLPSNLQPIAIPDVHHAR